MLWQCPLGGADTSPLARKVPRCLEPETGSAPKVLWLLLSFFSPHSHLHRLVLERSGNKDGSPKCFGKALSGGADTSPLAGKVPRYLEPETGSASEAVWLLPVPEAVRFCSPQSHLCKLVSVGTGNQDGSSRCSGQDELSDEAYLMCGLTDTSRKEKTF